MTMADEIEITNPGPQSYLEAAVAAIGEVNTDPSPPKAEPGEPAEPKPPIATPAPKEPEKKVEAKPEPVEEKPDPIAELEAKIAARRAKREQPPDEVTQLRQQIADMERRMSDRKSSDEDARIAKLVREGRWAEVAQAGGHDPLNAYDSFTKQAADAGKTQLEREIADLKQWKAQREQSEKEQAERARAEYEQRSRAEAHNTAIRQFIDHTSQNSTRFPRFSAVPVAQQARDAVYFADKLTEAGEEVTYERVATLAESHYEQLARKWAPTGANGTPTRAEAGGPKTLSNDLAAQSSGPDDREKTREDYFKDMMRALNSGA